MGKINIAELLKDCPKGMKLYSPIFGDVCLDKIRPHLAIVVTTDKEQDIFKEEFLYDGRYKMNGECMLFPSKGKTTWEGFIQPCRFKDGDILTSELGSIFILKEPDINKVYYSCYIALDFVSAIIRNSKQFCSKINCRFATEEEKQKLFDTIKANGYKWNPETKNLEKLPKFKTGDRIRHKNNSSVYCTLEEYSEGISAYRTNIGLSLTYKDLEQWELAPNKFDIATLVPFESRVLVRDTTNKEWRPAFWGYYKEHASYRYVTTVGIYYCCIPYEGNEHLLGKTDDCDDFYKTWENES